MTFFVPMNRAQLAAELDRIHLNELANEPLAAFLAAGKAKTGNKAKPVQWPENLDPETVLRAIAFQPLGQVSTYSVDTTEHHLIVDTPEAGQLAMLSIAADRATLTYGLTPTELAQIFGEALGSVEAAPPMPFEAEFSLQTATAYCAIVDWIRLMTAASLVERTGLQTLAADLDALVDMAKQGGKETDHRWLSAFLPKLFGETGGMTRTKMKESVEALEGDGLVAIAKNKKELLIRPSASLIPVALNLMLPAPIILLGGRGEPASKLLARGNSVWKFERSESRCFIASIDGLDALATIGSALSAKRLSWGN